MLRSSAWFVAAAAAVSLARPAGLAQGAAAQAPRRNVILFVADGLRHGSVNERDTPALWAVRNRGVHFRNSYSVFPTFTMANSSAIATGHQLGDTGIFANVLWPGFAPYDNGDFDLAPASPTPFIENDRAIADLDAHFRGNVLGEETLLSLARAHGYNTAAIGKLGPAGLQSNALAAEDGRFPSPPATVVIDDLTDTPAGVPLPPALRTELADAHLPAQSPARNNGYPAHSPYDNGYAGDFAHPGTIWANVVQQQWFVDVTTRILLPDFARDRRRPFALVFWSRDPDASQHDEGDSMQALSPGINGPTSAAGVRNADWCLGQILAWLDAHPDVKADTDVVVTSDHGFATISRREIDRAGALTKSEAAQRSYVDGSGRVEGPKGTLPNGFLALDLAYALQTNVFDPDARGPAAGRAPFRKVRMGPGLDVWEHPSSGSALLGPDVWRQDAADAKVIVAANGGADLLYVPDGKAETVRRLVDLLLGYDYVGGVFVDDKYGAIPGTLPLSAINLVGSSATPRPAIVVAFKVFYADPDDLMSGVQVSDTSLQEGQGMHGGFGRECTWNNMAAMGPDFKAGFADDAPVGNVDVVPTLAHVLGFEAAGRGPLGGRVAREALAGGPPAPAVATERQISAPAGGVRTVLLYQALDGRRYLQAACLARGDAERTTCR